MQRVTEESIRLSARELRETNLIRCATQRELNSIEAKTLKSICVTESVASMEDTVRVSWSYTTDHHQAIPRDELCEIFIFDFTLQKCVQNQATCYSDLFMFMMECIRMQYRPNGCKIVMLGACESQAIFFLANMQTQ